MKDFFLVVNVISCFLLCIRFQEETRIYKLRSGRRVTARGPKTRRIISYFFPQHKRDILYTHILSSEVIYNQQIEFVVVTRQRVGAAAVLFCRSATIWLIDRITRQPAWLTEFLNYHGPTNRDLLHASFINYLQLALI